MVGGWIKSQWSSAGGLPPGAPHPLSMLHVRSKWLKSVGAYCSARPCLRHTPPAHL